MSARGQSADLLSRITELEDRVRLLEQGVGLSSMTFHRIRITDRTGRGKYEISANIDGLVFQDLVAGSETLVMPIPEGFSGTGSGGSTSTTTTTTVQGTSEVIFSLAGAVTAGATSPLWSPALDSNAQTITGHLTSAGTTSTVVTMLKNGTTWLTLTFAAGITRFDLSITGIPMSASDNFAATITTAGTGASTLSLQLRYTPL